jgi:hypothetical protein
VVVSGGNILVTFQDIAVIGEWVGDQTDTDINGYNIGFPLIATAFRLGLEGEVDLIMNGCEVDGFGRAIEYFDTNGGIGSFVSNTISNAGDIGIWLGWGNEPCALVTITDNTFNHISAMAIYKNDYIQNYCFANNIEDGEPMTDNCN